MKYLFILGLILVQTNVAANKDFSVKGQKISVRPMSDQGQGVYLNDKLVHFFPVSKRADLATVYKTISDYGLNDKQKVQLNNYLIDSFDSGLKGPSSEDLIETSIALAKVSNDIMSKELEEDCLKDKEKNVEKKPIKKEVVYCECELPKELSKQVSNKLQVVPSYEDKYWDDFSLLGEVEKVSFSIDTSNDNHLHGLWRNITDPSLDGNDRGRTFGLALDYEAVGDLGEMKIEFESVIFTQLRETSPGSERFYIDGEGKFLQDQLERNRLDLKLLRRIDGGDTFVIGGFELQQLTADGAVAGPLQDGWHELFKDNNVIQYTNQDFMEDDIDFSLYGGLGKEWLSDLGNWKCRTRLEGTVGVNVLDFHDLYIKGRAEVELNSNEVFNGTEDNPWFLVSMWAETSMENQGRNQYSAGANISTPIQAGGWEIKPQIGMSMYSEKEDHFFSQSQSKKLEPQSHVGITFTKKF